MNPAGWRGLLFDANQIVAQITKRGCLKSQTLKLLTKLYFAIINFSASSVPPLCPPWLKNNHRVTGDGTEDAEMKYYFV